MRAWDMRQPYTSSYATSGALYTYSCEDGEAYVGPEPSVLACKVVHA